MSTDTTTAIDDATPATFPTLAPHRQGRLGFTDLTIEMGALTQSPIWETHKRGKNWMAAIAKDPKSPGGLARSFAQKAKGDYFYLIPSPLAPGTVLEFGADYYTGAGHPSRDRRYYVVFECDDTSLVLDRYETHAQAFAAAPGYMEPTDVELDKPSPREAAIMQIRALMAEFGILPSDL